MKVTIKHGKEKKEIVIDGNTVMPWYINVLSITRTKDGLEFDVLEDYSLKKSYNPQTLWLIGKNKTTLTKQIEDEVPAKDLQFTTIM